MYVNAILLLLGCLGMVLTLADWMLRRMDHTGRES